MVAEVANYLSNVLLVVGLPVLWYCRPNRSSSTDMVLHLPKKHFMSLYPYIAGAFDTVSCMCNVQCVHNATAAAASLLACRPTTNTLTGGSDAAGIGARTIVPQRLDRLVPSSHPPAQGHQSTPSSYGALGAIPYQGRESIC